MERERKEKMEERERMGGYVGEKGSMTDDGTLDREVLPAARHLKMKFPSHVHYIESPNKSTKLHSLSSLITAPRTPPPLTKSEFPNFHFPCLSGAVGDARVQGTYKQSKRRATEKEEGVCKRGY